MIYQLLRRDPAWRLMPLAAAGGGLCMLVSSEHTEGMFVGTLLYAFLTLAELRRRATLFDAALPIPARDLFTARCVALAALTWLPVLAAVGVAFVKGDTALGAVDCGAGASLLIIAVLSVRHAEVEAPLSSVQILLPLAAGLGVLAFEALPASPVLAFCAIASVTLFARIWRAMPESFQVAPAAAQSPSSRRRAKSAFATPWLLLMRTAVPLRGLLFLPIIFQTVFMRASSWPGVCCFGIFASGLLVPHTQWLSPLPIARRTLLAIGSAIATLMVAVPYSVSAAFGWGGRASLRLGLINVICMMLFCMSELILVMAWGSYRIRLAPAWFRRGVFIPLGIVVALGPPVPTLFSLRRASSQGLVDAFMLRLSHLLPENPAVIFVIGTLVFAAMFRLLEKVDAQAEWPELFKQVPAGERNFLGLN